MRVRRIGTLAVAFALLAAGVGSPGESAPGPHVVLGPRLDAGALPERDAAGRLVPDPARFPDGIAALDVGPTLSLSDLREQMADFAYLGRYRSWLFDPTGQAVYRLSS